MFLLRFFFSSKFFILSCLIFCLFLAAFGYFTFFFLVVQTCDEKNIFRSFHARGAFTFSESCLVFLFIRGEDVRILLSVDGEFSHARAREFVFLFLFS